MGSPDFAVPSLMRLLDSRHIIAGVVTQPDRAKGRGGELAATPVKRTAIAAGLEVFQPENVNTAESVAYISARQPDAIITVAFGQLLKEPLLELAPKGAINIHASLLPAYRGAAPIHRAIINGETKTGVTSMFMDKGMDTGDMILCQETDILPDDDAGMLHDKLADLGAELLITTLDVIEAGSAPRTKQNDATATYAPLLKSEDEVIDWQREARELYDQIRGLAPWPVAYTIYKGKRLKVHKAAYCAENCRGGNLPPAFGMITAIDEDGIWIQTGNGQLCLKEVQPEGKAKMGAAEFTRGYRPQIGEMMM
jgi:methionyl-tRNA formyltransferase